MAKYRKILVAYDGSGSSKNALSLASHLAREEKSWIKVVAVVPAYEGDLELIGVENIKDAITGPGRQLLTDAMEIAEAEKIHILTDLEQGEPYEKIVHVADEENCDLIVLGRKGRHPLERELMGAVTARVIGHTHKDVLVVPEQCKELKWGSIMLATDGSKYSASSMNKALDLARDHGSTLTLVSVIYSNDEFMALAPQMANQLIADAKKMLEQAAAEAADAGVTVETVVREGEPHEAITKLAAESGTNLIIMGSHGRKGVTRLLMGSVTERVIGYSPCPVLVSHLT